MIQWIRNKYGKNYMTKMAMWLLSINEVTRSNLRSHWETNAICSEEVLLMMAFTESLIEKWLCTNKDSVWYWSHDNVYIGIKKWGLILH